ncbi:matrixin family metalloprotease [Pseudohongiella sp.]|uniref:Peptidase metallopeptidase domain-containing protein n=1 Tax=marine sediment metagenome TaxID=412755 RepID=A0A0F9VXJ5_9ZZZZ|nr:matrixin family metalloprotease [Pseudohongiella sp.]HDZ08726.1 matrixin family metalloprotease [Pseudohongiella sp.]HEA62342.1 matrixin family metalloprotease [Pseudohongiella sp.]
MICNPVSGLRALRAVFCLSLLTTALLSSAAQAFDISANANKWPGAQTTIYTGVPGTSRSGTPWAVALQRAAGEWTDSTRFNFEASPSYRDPCAGSGPGGRPDFLNGIDFRANVCGDSFNSSTLAVTVFFTEFNILGTADIVEADIIFNDNLNFDVYDGPQRSGSNATREYDFQRIALHELGHVIGLGHDDSQAAIMSSTIGNLFRLQTDDISGADTLYAGIENCDYRAIRFGWVYGRLDAGDCRIQQLLSGGSDDSFVDVYTLDLTQDLFVTFDMVTDGQLDSVLFVGNANLGALRVDEDSAGNCNPRLTATLPAGRHTILVNTYSNNIDPPCGVTNTGNYRMSVVAQSGELLTLSGQQSFQGGRADAVFYGGVTTNGGQNYTNRVSSLEPFDVRGRIEIDPKHQGQPGFLAVALITPQGEILVKNTRGELVGYQPEVQLVPVSERKVLGAVEDLEVLTQFRAAEIGISEIDVDFYIGYGVDSNPGELYFNGQAINVLVE